MRSALPEGWTVEPAPEGALRIMLPRRSPRSSGLLLVAAGLACGVMGALLIGSLSRGVGGWRAWRLTALLPLGLLLIGAGLWLACGREEWQVAADRLEVRQGLFGFRKVRRFQGASLRLVASAAGGGSTRAQRRLLCAARAGGRTPSGTKNWRSLLVVTPQSRWRLASSSDRSLRSEELRALGELLAERTGWPMLFAGRRR